MAQIKSLFVFAIVLNIFVLLISHEKKNYCFQHFDRSKFLPDSRRCGKCTRTLVLHKVLHFADKALQYLFSKLSYFKY